MFKITNNNISITRGETATYDAVFKHSDGTPLTLDKNLVSDDKSVYGLFSVKLSMYDEDAVFRVPMKLDDLATFDTSADIIDIGDETFSNVNVPDSSISFSYTTKYKLFTVGSSIQNVNIVYNTNSGCFPFYCQATGNTFYFMNDDGGTITPGIYKATIDKTWLKNDALTTALPAYFRSGSSYAYAKVWYFDGNTYISGYFVSGNDSVYKTYLFDDSAVTPFTEVTFTGSGSYRYADFLWDDGDDLYLTKQDGNGVWGTYILDNGSFSFISVDIQPIVSGVVGVNVWKDISGNVYYSNTGVDGNTYKWNKTTKQWVVFSSNIKITTLPVIIKNKVYTKKLSEDYVLTSSSVGLVWEKLSYPINNDGTVWSDGTYWFTTKRSNPDNVNHTECFDRVDERADKLYKRTIATVPYYYKYVGNTQTVTEDDFEEYEFRLVFPFPYSIMKTMQPKLYKYEIALVGGTPTNVIANQTAITTQLPLTVDFKQYLVEFKDFKVEGSLSE